MNQALRKQLIDARSARIVVGSKVRFAGNFLRDTGQFAGDSGQLVGIVQEITPFGDNKLVKFTANGEEHKALACNLILAGEPDGSADW